jgi:hypothetical protein
MSNYDPTELVSFCESILEDGELTDDEIYRLAEWLNGQREACFHWPGELLVKPLQEIWSDGKVTKTELRQIGRLLLRIQKDWAKRLAENALQQAVDSVKEIAKAVDLSRPRLPSVPFVVRVKSHSQKGLSYDVDLSGPSCTWPNWHSYRRRLPVGHLSRCCKHVFDGYGQLTASAMSNK